VLPELMQKGPKKKKKRLFQRTKVRRKEDHSLQDGATDETGISRLVFGVQIADQWSGSLPGLKLSNL
jgi:hypothetical protein